MQWMRRLRGALGIGLTWAVGWAIAGVSIGVASILFPSLPWDAFFQVFDAPLPAFAVPGFVAGVFFSAVLAIAGRRRAFHELSLPRFAAWGAVTGLLLTAFPFALVAVGLASREGSTVGTWRIVTVITGPFVLLSAASAAASLLLARRAARRELQAVAQAVGATLAADDRRALPAEGDIDASLFAHAVDRRVAAIETGGEGRPPHVP